MNITRALNAVVVAVSLGVASAAAPNDLAQAADCDRACLSGMADQYVAALVAHKPTSLPALPRVRFTENLVPLRFGEQGLWRTANGRRDFDIHAVDTASHSVVWIGIIKENDKPVMVALRLKMDGRRIAEAETVVGRSPLSGAATVAAPRPDFAEIIPESERLSRARLIAIADSNWDAMERGDGHLAPYAVDCERYDNGEKTSQGTSPAPGAADTAGAIEDRSCFGQMNSGRFNNGNRVDPRRIWAVDREHGIVVGLFTPNVPGDAREIHLRSGKVLTPDATELIPFTIVQVEMFRIVRGQITRVEVVLGPRVPFGMRSPFDMDSLWQERQTTP